MKTESRVERTRAYFERKLVENGPTPAGVDWNSIRAQELRFEQLLKIVEPGKFFSINDYGCGYGALVDFIDRQGWSCEYTGYDLVELMIARAREIHGRRAACRFTADEASLAPADYTVASGIFNKRFDLSDADWLETILDTLQRLDGLSRKGFAFNMLTGYSDADRMRPDLYYGDPRVFFDYCKQRFSRNVALLHDYDLYDFTILVRKPAP